MSTRGPLVVAVVLLLLPVLYVGSYFALVTPPYHQSFNLETGALPFFSTGFQRQAPNYRWGDGWADHIFWPLEQIDHKVRPRAWEADLDFRLSVEFLDP